MYFFLYFYLVTSFSIETAKIMYFSVFSPEQATCWLNSSANFFYDKMIIIIGSIRKSWYNFFRYTIFWITYAMRRTSIFFCIMTMISNFTIFSIYHISFFTFFDKCNRLLHFHMIQAALLLKASFFLFYINYLHCVLFYRILKLFHTIITSVYIMLIFFGFKMMIL